MRSRVSNTDTTHAWPPTVHEKRPWRTNPDQHGLSGQRPNRADRMLTEIIVEIPPEIRDLTVGLSTKASALSEQARAEMAALEQAGGLGGLGDLLARTESVASSRIEHVNADLTELARATISESISDKAKRTMAAVTALSTLTSSCNYGAQLTESAILTAHGELLGDDPLEGPLAGTYRQQQNWIGGSDYSPRNAVHVPPPHADVPRLMRDLVTFANREDVPAVAQAAITHGQFESIHPFTDGNGRIGRGLISASLRRRAVTERTVVPVAAAMLADVDTYFERLVAYRDGDDDALISYVATCAIEAASASRTTANRLATLPEQWQDRVRGRRGSALRALTEQLIEHPVLDIHRAEAMTGASRMRVYNAIDKLVDADVLEEITGGGRNRIWLVGDLRDELADLEDRIGERITPAKGGVSDGGVRGRCHG